MTRASKTALRRLQLSSSSDGSSYLAIMRMLQEDSARVALRDFAPLMSNLAALASSARRRFYLDGYQVLRDLGYEWQLNDPLRDHREDAGDGP